MPSPPGAAALANVGSMSSFYSWSSCLSVQALYTPLHPIKISFLDGCRKLFILVLFCLSSQTKPFHFMAQTEPRLYLFCVSRYHFHWCIRQNEKKRKILCRCRPTVMVVLTQQLGHNISIKFIYCKYKLQIKLAHAAANSCEGIIHPKASMYQRFMAS